MAGGYCHLLHFLPFLYSIICIPPLIFLVIRSLYRRKSSFLGKVLCNGSGHPFSIWWILRAILLLLLVELRPCLSNSMICFPFGLINLFPCKWIGCYMGWRIRTNFWYEFFWYPFYVPIKIHVFFFFVSNNPCDFSFVVMALLFHFVFPFDHAMFQPHSLFHFHSAVYFYHCIHDRPAIVIRMFVQRDHQNIPYIVQCQPELQDLPQIQRLIRRYFPLFGLPVLFWQPVYHCQHILPDLEYHINNSSFRWCQNNFVC